MNVLVYPMFSRANLNADSCYVMIRQVILAARKFRDDLFWDILWPSNGKDWPYTRDGLFDLRNVRRLPLRFHPAKIKQVVHYDPFALQPYLDYKVPVDVIWNFAVEQGDVLRNHVATYDVAGKSFVVNNHNYILHPSLPYPVDADQSHVMLRQLCGAWKVDRNVFISDYCRWMFFDNATRCLSVPIANEIRETAVVVPNGTLDPQEMERNREPRADTFTFAYNHRLQSYKNYKETFDVFADLWRGGYRFRVVVFSVPGDERNASWVSKFPFADVFVSDTRDAYLRKLSTCHVNTLNSQHETFCISAVESMYYGQPIVAPDGMTFPEISGAKTNGYPWLFRTRERQIGALRNLLGSPAQVEKWGSVVHEHVTTHYLAEHFARGILRVFDDLMVTHDIRASLKKPVGIVKLISSRPQWLVEDLRREIYSGYDGGRLLGSNQSFPATKIVRLARQLGYRDAREQGTRAPMIVREAVDHG